MAERNSTYTSRKLNQNKTRRWTETLQVTSERERNCSWFLWIEEKEIKPNQASYLKRARKEKKKVILFHCERTKAKKGLSWSANWCKPFSKSNTPAALSRITPLQAKNNIFSRKENTIGNLGIQFFCRIWKVKPCPCTKIINLLGTWPGSWKSSFSEKHQLVPPASCLATLWNFDGDE